MDLTLTLSPTGTIEVWTLGSDWVDQYWIRRTLEEHPVKFDGFFVSRQAALDAALDAATVVQPALVEPGRIDGMSSTNPDWFALDRWLREHRGEPGERQFSTRAVNVEVVAMEDGAMVRWKHEDCARIVRKVPREVVVDGVTFTASPETVTVAESPWFPRQIEHRLWNQTTVEDVWRTEPVYISSRTIRFCGVCDAR